jgi:hypothetical protein
MAQIAPSSANRAADTVHHLAQTGQVQVLRIIRATRVDADVLEFDAQPTRPGSALRGIRVRFAPAGSAPRIDASGRLELFYPDRDHHEVQALLNAKRNRFCYLWRSATGGRTHAWLITSP